MLSLATSKHSLNSVGGLKTPMLRFLVIMRPKSCQGVCFQARQNQESTSKNINIPGKQEKEKAYFVLVHVKGISDIQPIVKKLGTARFSCHCTTCRMTLQEAVPQGINRSKAR